ncbi:MAG: hypothetical protein J1F60_07990 [Oscillospiraceae bacterium]|nr:hypothetical protein [Oscillospiraceae bacterium]
MFAIPVLLLRRKLILKKLRECGAVSEDSAKTLREAGVFNPDAFPRVLEDLVNRKILIKTESQKYYLAG